MGERRIYKWLYDHFMSRIYDVFVGVITLPFGGAATVYKEALPRTAVGDEPLNIVELCCGTGSVARLLALRFPSSRVTAIDLSNGQIEKATRKLQGENVDLIVGDATQSGIPEGSRDLVVIAFALHEMDRDTRFGVLYEAHRILKKGGILHIAEHGKPHSLFWRMVQAIFWFYWLPGNPETPTRRDMQRHGLLDELQVSHFTVIEECRPCHGAVHCITAGR